MKVFISPSPQSAPFGLARVMEALHRFLPEQGVEVVYSEAEADVVHVHSMAFVETNKPVVYTSHGLHWEDQQWPSPEYYQANQFMIDYMKRAQAVTAVSSWVGHAISRGMLVEPYIINNGIYPEDWEHDRECLGYVLWNKARADVVCDPAEMNRLAERMPNTNFVSTFGTQTANVQITGVVPYEQMQDMVMRAGVYLSLARETFGIGTLEAMAAGVPVVGWNHGGNRDIIEPGVNGFLVPYGDYENLATAVSLASIHREEMRQDMRRTIKKWDWRDVAKEYAQVYEVAATPKHHVSWVERPKVSVIITAHNLDKYLRPCLESVKAQTLADFECLIIDDFSTDGTQEIGEEYDFNVEDTRFSYIRTPSNLKLSGARNYGYQFATGDYILFLDADDMIAPDTLELLAGALDADPNIHIAYGRLDTISEDGTNRRANEWPMGQFNWHNQMRHLNQLPYCSMMRTEVMERSGGYRVRDYLAEDAAFWCRVTSLGFTAKCVTEQPTLIYRLRPDSKSTNDRAKHGHGQFTQWFGWKVATNPNEGTNAAREDRKPNRALVPFGAQGRSDKWCWPVWSHHDPVVSVIIPVGPGHEGYLMDALDSLLAQSFPFWEAVVVNDTGRKLNLQYAPWARIIDNGEHNIAISRNLGIEHSRADLLLFLDADDFLAPEAIKHMLQAYVDNGGAKYIYTDWYNVQPGKPATKHNANAFNQSHTSGTQHPVSALVRKEHATAVGGFDPSLPGWEDWEFYIKMAINGFCGARLPEGLLVYRLHSGERREDSLLAKDETLSVLKERYAKFFTNEERMMGCCDGDDTSVMQAKRALGLVDREVQIELKEGHDMVKLQFTGTSKGTRTFTEVGGIHFNPPIKAGNNALHRYCQVNVEQARALINTGLFKQVDGDSLDLQQAVQVAPTVPPPNPVFPEPPKSPPRPDALAGQPTAAQSNPAPQENTEADFMKPTQTAVEQPGAYFDPKAKTISEIKTLAPACSKDVIKQILAAEEDGGNGRLGAIRFLKGLLE